MYVGSLVQPEGAAGAAEAVSHAEPVQPELHVHTPLDAHVPRLLQLLGQVPGHTAVCTPL